MEAPIDFKSYLSSKKIDADKFSSEESEKYSSLQVLFDQMHPNSFTAQKLFLINPIRIKYPLRESSIQEVKKPKKAMKPKFKRP